MVPGRGGVSDGKLKSIHNVVVELVAPLRGVSDGKLKSIHNHPYATALFKAGYMRIGCELLTIFISDTWCPYSFFKDSKKKPHRVGEAIGNLPSAYSLIVNRFREYNDTYRNRLQAFI